MSGGAPKTSESVVEQSQDSKRLSVIMNVMGLSDEQKLLFLQSKYLHMAYTLNTHDYRCLLGSLLDASSDFMEHIARYGDLSARFWVGYVEIHFELENVRNGVCNAVTYNRHIGVDFVNIVIAEQPDWFDEIQWHGVVGDPRFTQEMYDQIDNVSENSTYAMCLTVPYVNEMYLNLRFMKEKPDRSNSHEWLVYVQASAQTSSPDLEAIAHLYKTRVYNANGSFICPGWQCNPKCTEEFLRANVEECEYDCIELSKNTSLSAKFLMTYILQTKHKSILDGSFKSVTINSIQNLFLHPNIGIFHMLDIVKVFENAGKTMKDEQRDRNANIINRFILTIMSNPNLSDADIETIFTSFELYRQRVFDNGYSWDDYTTVISEGIYTPVKWIRKFKKGFWGGGCTRITKKLFDLYICTPENIKTVLNELSRTCSDPNCLCHMDHTFKFEYLLVGDRSLADEESVDKILTWICEYNKNIKKGSKRVPVNIDWNSILYTGILNKCVFKHFSRP